MKKKIIIFGFGYYGKNAYQRLKSEYEILYFADNNEKNNGMTYNSIQVINGSKIRKYLTEEVDIIICSSAYFEIASQLNDMGIYDYYVMLEGFLYHCGLEEIMAPIELRNVNNYKKVFKTEKNILFVQNVACTRTIKIADVMKKQGYKVFLLYTVAPPYGAYESKKSIFETIWGFTSANGIYDFVNGSDFDIVHCSNEPNILINIVQNTNKIIVNDTHDMESLRGDISIDAIALEYLANCYKSKNMYVSKEILEIAKRKFNNISQNSYYFNNYVLDEISIPDVTEKLSMLDNEIHCVYEGAITSSDKMHHRYFDEFWKKITDEGIHIHFYSGSEISLCKRLESISSLIHYEGNKSGDELIQCMTKYDCGLALFNVTPKNKLHLENTSINKVYEYLNSGLPVLSYGIDSLKNYLEKNAIGFELDFEKNITAQIEKLVKIIIPRGFLSDNKLTMMANANELVDYYESIKGE